MSASEHVGFEGKSEPGAQFGVQVAIGRRLQSEFQTVWNQSSNQQQHRLCSEQKTLND